MSNRDSQELPLLTIGILSWNRLHYLRATLESARRCIKYPRIEWIVLDNESTEPGLKEYLRGLEWVDQLYFMKCDHVTAMNHIVSKAKGEVLLLWPDDMQFTVEGDWMRDCVEVLLKDRSLGSMVLNALRRETIQRMWHGPISKRLSPWLYELKSFGAQFRKIRTLRSISGLSFVTHGWNSDGIGGAGIATLTRTEVWRTLGPWIANNSTGINDSSGGGETEMLYRWRATRWPLQKVSPAVPFSADIINDALGTKAKIRGDFRYGEYSPPPDGLFYYQIQPLANFRNVSFSEFPLAFEDVVTPLGFALPLDKQGGLLKFGINLSIKESIAA